MREPHVRWCESWGARAPGYSIVRRREATRVSFPAHSLLDCRWRKLQTGVFMEPTLFLDAASPAIAVGLRLDADGPTHWARSNDEAGVAIFRTTESLLREHGAKVSDITQAVFCEGPGSLLGVRLVAMALRTWSALPRAKPWCVLGYRSLELVAATLLARGETGPFHVIADGRRGTWNITTVGPEGGGWAPLRRHPADVPLPEAGAVFHPRSFPLWQTLPAGAVSVDYSPENLPELSSRFPLLRTVESPDAFMIEMPTYREWTPEHPARPSRP